MPRFFTGFGPTARRAPYEQQAQQQGVLGRGRFMGARGTLQQQQPLRPPPPPRRRPGAPAGVPGGAPPAPGAIGAGIGMGGTVPMMGGGMPMLPGLPPSGITVTPGMPGGPMSPDMEALMRRMMGMGMGPFGPGGVPGGLGMMPMAGLGPFMGRGTAHAPFPRGGRFEGRIPREQDLGFTPGFRVPAGQTRRMDVRGSIPSPMKRR